ncbi:MAG TPA: Coenzyme F420 hydrogenase/dehydrogenase, beta subunit C-terminal domain [Acidimicrobiales bacterium]|jgi:coenzyme F420 hydrogenase subunit beta|nr:Coenzyme F420 hydrogenase/dehydrogenase, beta subunit C-terminal domain [Acidimicrobiales bacterium]HJM38455.1 Coenzyme F420 hydrogenase/dehydrogenase, beta subunit C-terminal domain [Acidimicrobiales bacterium]
MATTKKWTFQWKELYDEVITSGLCTGCAGCVIACPHDVIGYQHAPGAYKPFHLEEELGLTDCAHGQKGCTSCTRACPRFRDWETEADNHLFARHRKPEEMSGIYKDVLLTRASDETVHRLGQDGGLVSSILIWCLENNVIDGALTSHLEANSDEESTNWKAIPALATDRESVLAGAGSRYTYSANTLAIKEAREKKLESLALVGMSCQTSIGPVMWHRRVGKAGKPIKLNIGLLCSKSFDDSIFEDLFWAKYGLAKKDMVKMNIKGVFQIWMRNGDYHEINLKECHAWTREGCNHCPDFAAEHADISTGGIGENNDWTLTIVRTELGRQIIMKMLEEGVIEGKPGDSDPGAIALMHKLSAKSRSRWPDWANPQARTGLEVTAG